MKFKIITTLLLSLGITVGSSKEKEMPDENFMLVLRESEDANKQEFGFQATGPLTMVTNTGEEIKLSNAWYELIGDMHIRFVIDDEHMMQNLNAEAFNKLGLTPEQAAEIAIKNIKKRYGNPESSHWEEGVMMVSGKSPDLDSSYFLDTEFWNKLAVSHPEGLIVGVPKRGGLIYAPVTDKRAVSYLEKNIISIHKSSERMRISSKLYLFKNGKWTVYNKPNKLH
jgi:hypothetical protein